jgi:hypothetical protein
MKNTLFGLLAIVAAFCCGCNSNPTGNHAANDNRALGEGKTYPIGINLALKPGSDTYHFEVAPEDATLKVEADQVQWVVTNFTDLALSDLTINHFKGRRTGNTDPFENGGTFTYPAVNGRSTEGGLRTGTSSIIDIFDYQISATLTLKDGKKVTVTLDPRIVISS